MESSSTPSVSGSPGNETALVDGSVLRVWALFAGCGALLPLVLDPLAGELTCAGRIFLSSLLVFHLILVPGRTSGTDLLGWSLESGILALLALPLAEIVRGMTGAGMVQLPWVAALLFFAHLTGRIVGVVGGARPGFLRLVYCPSVILITAALPLLAYVAGEFFGAGDEILRVVPVGPFLTLLDGGP